MYVCMHVSMFLRMCSIIASMRLKLDLEGVYHMIRCVAHGGGAKLNHYVSLHRGRGSDDNFGIILGIRTSQVRWTKLILVLILT